MRGRRRTGGYDMSEDSILEAAAEWHARQHSDEFDWQAFEAWLGADPRHCEAFDEIALLDADIDRHRDVLRHLLPDEERQPVVRPTGSHGWLFAGGSLAAAVAACLVAVVWRSPSPSLGSASGVSYSAAAVGRDIRIAGADVTLAPHSRVVTASNDPTTMSLTGRAIFAVRHDPSRTLTIRAAGFEVRDVGTRFEIVSGASTIRVAVAEGEVTLRAARNAGEPIRVSAGHSATGSTDGRIVTARAGATPLGGWRTGPLVYTAMPLGLVAADVARATGTSITIDDRLGSRPFSGVLATGDRDAMVATLVTLAGLEARRQGETIHLGARGGRLR